MTPDFGLVYPTENTWIYDARTNVPGITKMDRPLAKLHFTEFEKCYGPDPNGNLFRTRVGSGFTIAMCRWNTNRSCVATIATRPIEPVTENSMSPKAGLRSGFSPSK